MNGFHRGLALAGLTLGMLGGAFLAALPAGAQVYVRVGPPPPRVERIPPPPGPAYAWDRGHWRWDGHRYVWVRGRYLHRPRGVARWIPGHWARTANGRSFWVPGHWV